MLGVNDNVGVIEGVGDRVGVTEGDAVGKTVLKSNSCVPEPLQSVFE